MWDLKRAQKKNRKNYSQFECYNDEHLLFSMSRLSTNGYIDVPTGPAPLGQWDADTELLNYPLHARRPLHLEALQENLEQDSEEDRSALMPVKLLWAPLRSQIARILIDTRKSRTVERIHI